MNFDDTDLLSTDSIELTPDKPAEWGEYQFKPAAQCQWEDMVKATVAEITEHQVKLDRDDLRPFVKDQGSAQWCLIDTGAAATIIPRDRNDPNQNVDSKVRLKAVNGTTVQT